MNIRQDYSAETAKEFCTELFEELQKHPFASMPKRDSDCLLFFLLEKRGLIPGKNNWEKAKSLGINETKLKSYILDSHAKYGKEDNEEKENNLNALLNKIKNDSSKVSIDGDYLIIPEENPIIKADFIQSLKEEGFYTDGSFNNELIKVKVASFLSFIAMKGLLEPKHLTDNMALSKEELKMVNDFSKTLKSESRLPIDIAKKIGLELFDILKSSAGGIIPQLIPLLSK